MKILYFGAEFCPTCKVMKPKFIAECQRLGFTDYEFVDGEENEELVEKYGIRNLPTLVFLDGDVVKGKEFGANAWMEVRFYL